MNRTVSADERSEVLVAELDREARSTRRVLERVPAAKLSWRPHPKSWSLGQLALHVAAVPGGIAHLLAADSAEAPVLDQEEARTPADLLSEHDKGVAAARQFLAELTPERSDAVWRLQLHGREILAVPRIAMVRTLMLNHWYHHRGSLVVYLRLLDVPVPSVYGPSADESPFGS